MNVKPLKNWILFVRALLFLFLVSVSFSLVAKGSPALDTVWVADLPVQAQKTLKLIKQGGPFPYAKDGTVFGNYEERLPKQKRGYYREFTVKTEGVRHRGAQRIVTGGELPAPREYYYTDDHYATFRRIRE